MTTIATFKDIIAWRKSQELSLDVYSAFKNCRDYSFRDQIQRASVSIMNNIAEGFERKGDREFRRFLLIAQGSCAEVRSMISLAEKLNYLSAEQARSLEDKGFEITKMLSVFIKRLGD